MIKRKINLSPRFLKARGLLIKLIISSIIIFIGIRYLKEGLKNSDYFKIKDIIVSEQKRRTDFSYLKGQNIFAVDLKRESGYISQLYPAYRKIGLIRIFPNRLYIGFATRKPLAYVKLYRYFCVDEDRVFFDSTERLPDASLPLIIGLGTKIPRATIGKQHNVKELAVALDIIKEMKINRSLKDYRIKTIDITNPVTTSFFIFMPLPESVDLEVRLGEDKITDKMRILAGIFTQLKNDLSKIKYIDLRFKEAVIKFK